MWLRWWVWLLEGIFHHNRLAVHPSRFAEAVLGANAENVLDVGSQLGNIDRSSGNS